MRYLISMLVIITGLHCLSDLSQAQTITQEEFLNQLKRTHPFFKREELTGQIKKAEKGSFPGAEEWNMFYSAKLSHETPALAFAGPERITSYNISTGANRLFWKTGGRLSATVSTKAAVIKLPPQAEGFPESFVQHQIDVTYTHPLMRNKHGFLDRLEYRLKQFDIDFSEVQALENQENFLTEAAGKFLEWAFFDEQLKIIQDRLSLSEEELVNVQKKKDARLVDQVDVIRAQDAVRLWKQNLFLTKSLWKALQAEMAAMTQNEEFYLFTPVFNIYETTELISLNDAITHLKENTRLIQILDINKKHLSFYRKGFEEQLKPDLSFFSQMNIKKADDKILKSFILDKPDVSVGLNYSFPRKNIKAKAKISQTDLQIEQLKKEKESVIISLSASLTNLYVQLNEIKEVLKLNQEQILSAEEKTKEELKMYNQGRGELTFVIQSRDSEQNAKLTYAENAFTYHRLLIQVRSLLDMILK